MTALSEIFREIDERLKAIDLAQSYERMPSGDPDTFPALQAYDFGDEPAEDQETGNTRLDLLLSVEGFVEGFHGAAVHDAMTELHAATVAALCGDENSNLGGLVQDIKIVGRRRVDVAELASKRRLGFAQDFGIQYATERGNPAIRL